MLTGVAAEGHDAWRSVCGASVLTDDAEPGGVQCSERCSLWSWRSGSVSDSVQDYEDVSLEASDGNVCWSERFSIAGKTAAV